MYLGNVIPSIGQVFKVQTTCIRLLKNLFFSYSRFGTWKIPVGRETTDQVDQAISVGFNHIGELYFSSWNPQNSLNLWFYLFLFA